MQFPNANIVAIESVENARHPIGLDEVSKWIVYLNEFFERSKESEVLLRVTGVPTPEATKHLRQYFDEKGAFYASADMIVFPGIKSGVRCIRILGVGLDLHYEMNDEESNESDESDEIDPYMSQDVYASRS
jgi:hypothetical protein